MAEGSEGVQHQDRLPRHDLYLLMYSVIFGVCLAAGGSILEPFPLFYTSCASLWVALMMTANKLLMQRRYSVMLMYVVASPIAAMTTYLAPFPTPLKLLFILGGLSFDLGSGLRTKRISRLALVVGHACATASGFGLTWVIIYVHTPAIALNAVTIWAFLIAAPVHFVICIVTTMVLYPMLVGPKAMHIARLIRSQVEKPR